MIRDADEAPLSNDEVCAGERPVEGLRALADVAPPPSLVAKVMNQVEKPSSFSFWRWLVRPRRVAIRLSPLAAVMGIATVVLVVTAFVGARKPGEPLVLSVPESTTQVRFVLVAHGAKKVALAGDWNGWDASALTMEQVDDAGTFAVTVRLAPGRHEYMFVVDGAWVTDPAAQERIPDGFGHENAVLRL